MAVDARHAKARRPRRWWWAAGVVALLAAAAALLLVLGRGGASTSSSAAVTTTVRRAPFQMTVNGPGTLSPIRSVDLNPRVGGTLVAVAGVGDRVEAGGVVARIDPTPFERALTDARLSLEKAEGSLASLQAGQARAAASLASQVASARASLEAAQRSSDSQQRSDELTHTLYAMGSASANELQASKDALASAREALAQAKTELATLLSSQQLQRTADARDLANARVAVEQARLSVSSAQQDLHDTTLTAPFGGVVSAVQASVGETAGTASALLTLVDDSSVILQAQIDETDIARVGLGQSADVTLDAASQDDHRGRVRRISPTATLVSNIPVFYVEVALDNPDHELRAGMTGQATIVVREIADAFRVPARAVHSGNDGSYLLVRQGPTDGGYQAVPVTQVGTAGLDSVLTGEVSNGATVLVSGDAAGTGGGPAAPGGQRRPGAVPLANPGRGFSHPRRVSTRRRRRP